LAKRLGRFIVRTMRLNILVPHDLSARADDALAWAVRLVSATGGSIELAHVVSLLPPIANPANPPSRTDIETARTALAERARGLPVPVQIDVVVAADVGEALVLRAKQRHVDLVVIGTHGRGGVARALIGSVADYVVRHAECPVLTVRAPRP